MLLKHARRGAVATAPFLFAVGGTLYLATDMAAPAGAYVRPMLVAVALTAITFAVVWLMARSADWASIVSSALVLFTFRLVIPALVLVTIALWWALVGALRRTRRRAPPDAAIPRQLALLTTLAGLALAAITGWATAVALAGPSVQFRIPEYHATGSGGPNIYVLLLDGYPRSDSLKETFGIDNGVFLAELQELGFVVSDGARSNYNKTWSTLASAFNGAYLDRMLPPGEPPVDPATQIRWLRRLIDEASLLDVLRERRYVIRTVPSHFVTTALTSADDYIDHGHLNELESKLIMRSPWAYLAPRQIGEFLLADHRAAVIDSLESAASLAEHRVGGAQFVFAHILSPHTPFVLGAKDLGHFDLPPCFPQRCSLWQPTVQDLQIGVHTFRDALAPQIRELNRLVVLAAERIVAADPTSVIVLMSDHGIRYSLEDLPEHYRTFLAVRSPGGALRYAHDESPVNVLRGLMAYLGEDMPLLPYERWGGSWDTYLRLRLLEQE